MLILSRGLVTTSKRISVEEARSFRLTLKVRTQLQSDHKAKFHKLLTSFRKNLNDDEMIKPIHTRHDQLQSGIFYLTSNAMIVSVDVGGEEPITDVGICLLDKLTNSLYKFQINIKNRKLSRRSSRIENLMTTPLVLTEDETVEFIRQVLNSFSNRNILIIGHNLAKDLKSLHKLKWEIPMNVHILCTESLFKQSNGEGTSLRKLCVHLNVKLTKPFHPSINDAYYTMNAFLKMLKTPKFQLKDYSALQREHKEYMTKVMKKMGFYYRNELLINKNDNA